MLLALTTGFHSSQTLTKMKLEVIQQQLKEHLSQRQTLLDRITADQRDLDAVSGAIQAIELLVKKEQERLAKRKSVNLSS